MNDQSTRQLTSWIAGMTLVLALLMAYTVFSLNADIITIKASIISIQADIDDIKKGLNR